MAIPTLTPRSSTSAIRLPATGNVGDVTANNLPFGVYATNGALQDSLFLTGAAEQVSYTYRKLGGDILDIELTAQNVYAAYEESVLEYSYIVNTHQAKNILFSVLGDTTGTFDSRGNLRSADPLSSSLPNKDVSLKYPRFEFGMSKRVSRAVSTEAGFGGHKTMYSASFDTEVGQQDYDLQNIIYSASVSGDNSLSSHPFYNKVGKNKLTVRKVYYKTPSSMWRFYGYYGGLNTVGSLHTYGQFADDSNFEVVPAWQNKLQAMAFEDSLYTRTSHWAYEVKNNRLRVFPEVVASHPSKMWVEFEVEEDAWSEEEDRKHGADGINNMNTLPFGNIPFKYINSIGKQWIRRFALSLTKEMLAHVRGKFSTIPIPGESVTLNHSELLSQAKEEQDKLREELKTTLDELTYAKLAETEASIMDNTNKTQANVPSLIYVG